MIEKKIDVTENYIRIRLREPGLFKKGSFRTIWISKKQGIKSVMGKLKSNNKFKAQNVMFDRKKGWNVAKAKKWLKNHPEIKKSIDDNNYLNIWEQMLEKEEHMEKNKKEQVVNYGVRLPIQFSKSYIEKDEHGEEKWYIEGLAAALGKDRNKPCYMLTDECLSHCVKDLKTNQVLFLEHFRFYPVGRIEQAKHLPGKGIWIKALISKTVPGVWKQIQEEILTGLSIGGRIIKFVEETAKKYEDIVRRVIRMELMEVSVVALPANVKTRIWNDYIKKSFDFKIPIEGGDTMNEEKDLESTEDKEVSEQLEDTGEEESTEKSEETTEEKSTEKSDEETTEEKSDDSDETKEDEKTEEKSKEKTEEKSEETTEEKSTEKSDEEPKEKTEEKNEEKSKEEHKVEKTLDFESLMKSIKDLKDSQVTKKDVEEIVKKQIGDCMPDEVRKGISLVKKEESEKNEKPKPLEDRLEDVLTEIDKQG